MEKMNKKKGKEEEVKKEKKEKKENVDWNGVAEGIGMSPVAGGDPCKRGTNTD